MVRWFRLVSNTSTFCEVFVRKILPNIKVYLASILVSKYGFSQLEASRLLGIKQPLLNYYIRGRRVVKYVDKLLSIQSVKECFDAVLEHLVSRRSSVINGVSLSCFLCRSIYTARGSEALVNLVGLVTDCRAYGSTFSDR